MNTREILDKVKAFGMTNQMLNEDLTRAAVMYGVDLAHSTTAPIKVEDVYYPQFAQAVRDEAASMAKHYELFYCLEKTIRSLVEASLSEAEGAERWWESARVSPLIRDEVGKRVKKEVDSAITRRSLEELDYTTFGELSVIITSNWDLFGSPLNSIKAVEKVMASLNSLRNPIAHCSPLGEDEELRLRLAVRDWFRLME